MILTHTKTNWIPHYAYRYLYFGDSYIHIDPSQVSVPQIPVLHMGIFYLIFFLIVISDLSDGLFAIVESHSNTHTISNHISISIKRDFLHRTYGDTI
jgi:hypothetical protein